MIMKKNQGKLVILGMIVAVAVLSVMPKIFSQTFKSSSSLIKSLNPSIKAKSFFESGKSYLDEHKFDEAITEFTNAIKIDPHYSDAYTQRGYIYRLKGKHDQAIEDFNKAIEIDPNNVEAYFNRGFTYYRFKGDYDQAIADFNKVIELDPSDKDAYKRRADSYLGRKDYTLAIVDYSKVIEIDPGDSNVYGDRGYTYRLKGNLDQSIADYDRAIGLVPIDSTDVMTSFFYAGRAAAYALKNNAERAIIDFTKAIEKNPEIYVYYGERGNVHYRKGHYNEAIADYNKAVELSSDSGDEVFEDITKAKIYYDRGRVYTAMGREYAIQAIADYSKALEIHSRLFKSYKFRVLDNLQLFEAHYWKWFASLPSAVFILGWMVCPFIPIILYYLYISFWNKGDKLGENNLAKEIHGTTNVRKTKLKATKNSLIIVGLLTFLVTLIVIPRILAVLASKPLTAISTATKETKLVKQSDAQTKQFLQRVLEAMESYRLGNNIFLEGQKVTKFDGLVLKIGQDVYVAKGYFEKMVDQTNNIKNLDEDNEISAIKRALIKAATIRIESVDLFAKGCLIKGQEGQAVYTAIILHSKQDIKVSEYNGQIEEGLARIKIANSYFLDALNLVRLYRDKTHFVDPAGTLSDAFFSNFISYYSEAAKAP